MDEAPLHMLTQRDKIHMSLEEAIREMVQRYQDLKVGDVLWWMKDWRWKLDEDDEVIQFWGLSGLIFDPHLSYLGQQNLEILK